MADERTKKPILQCESQDRQCNYNVTLRSVLATIVAAEEKYVLHILSVCRLSYPACDVYVPCHVWRVRLCPVFFHLMSQTVRFSKEVIEHIMCTLIFFTNFF